MFELSLRAYYPFEVSILLKSLLFFLKKMKLWCETFIRALYMVFIWHKSFDSLKICFTQYFIVSDYTITSSDETVTTQQQRSGMFSALTECCNQIK